MSCGVNFMCTKSYDVLCALDRITDYAALGTYVLSSS